MRILVQNWRDIKNPEAGGAEIYLHEILKRLARKGHEIVLVSSKYKGCKEQETVDGIKVVRIGNKYFFNFAFFWCYITRLRNENFDIVIDSISKVPLCAPFYVKDQIISVIYHIHGESLFRELPLYMALYVCLMERSLIPVFYRRSVVVTISGSTRDELIRFGLFSENIPIIYCGIDNSELALGRKSYLPTILYFGRVKKYKRLDHLVKAFQYIKMNVPDARLIIAGKGDDYRRLTDLAKKLRILDSVDFVGKVSEKEKIKLLQEAWVYVMPSIKEGWGISVIEANACGTPVVAYDVPGLRDSVRHGYNGFLVEDGNVNALAEVTLELIKNAGLRRKMEKNAIEWASRFSWDKSAEEFERVIKSVIAR